MKTIPFNYGDWKSGKGKAVYRDGKIPIRVVPVPESKEELHAILSVTDRGFTIWHYADGTRQESQGNCYSLLLQIDPEYIPLEQEDWIIGGPWFVRNENKFGREMRIPVLFYKDGLGFEKANHLLYYYDLMTEGYERTNKERMENDSIPADQKWIPCRKEKM